MPKAERTQIPHDWLVPDWPAPPVVRALFTSRAGGVSAGTYADFNLGDHVGDTREAVASNRLSMQAVTGVPIVFMNQVHGTECRELEAGDAVPGVGAPIRADAATTGRSGLACAVMVADCLPVFFTDQNGRRVAAAHAGWRGLAAGVLEETLRCFRPFAQAGSTFDATKTIAWLGPCIGPTAFEVGDEVKRAFEAQGQESVACFVPAERPGKWLADLPGLARQRLAASGVHAVFGNDGSPPWCTVNNPSRFFSHRRDGVSGRLAACIWIEP